MGIQNKINKKWQGGHCHFEMAVIYKNAYLISSILDSSEVLYGVTGAKYEQLESVDQMWINNLFDSSSFVPTDLL